MQSAGVTRRHVSRVLWAVMMVPLMSCDRNPVEPIIGQNAMQILLERSGGFTGIPLTLTIDTATLPPDQATQLHHMVEAADFFHLPATLSTLAQPDRFEYEITIQDGDRKHTVTVGEVAVPDSLRPLLNRLMEMTRQR